MHAHKTARLKEPLKEPYHHNLPGMVRETRAQRQQTPTEARRRQPDSGRHFLED